jgi:pSer/pThr/pTyr-binding forkhead associated (FHA) protein
MTVSLKVGSTVIGRDPSCDALIDSHHVSRCHAEVLVVGDQVFVEDLGSKNGTFVNGDRIGERRELNTGDRLRLSRHAATLQLVGGASTWTEMSGFSVVEEDAS